MEAVGGVEFERRNGISGYFVHRCGAKVLAGVGELRKAFFKADFSNIFRLDAQVAGLVLFVHESGVEEALLFAEGEDAVCPELWYCGESCFSFFQAKAKAGEWRKSWLSELRFRQ